METASLSVRPVLRHSLHNVIYITDERKSIQGSMSNKTLTQGVVLISISGLQLFFVWYQLPIPTSKAVSYVTLWTRAQYNKYVSVLIQRR